MALCLSSIVESVPKPENSQPASLAVLVSGTGTNLQALIDATRQPGYGAKIVAVGADRGEITGLDRAKQAGIPTFVVKPNDFPTRADWDAALTEAVGEFDPDLVVLAGFMRLVGEQFLNQFGGRTINTHPALSPAFPGVNGPKDALEYGVKVTGATLFLVDEGVDTGKIIDQATVRVEPDDDEDSLHEKIKKVERIMLVESVGRMVRNGWEIEDRWVNLK